jgi:hypothetical protein
VHMGKDARGLTLFWSINYLVPPELGVNRRSRQIVEAVVNATNVTSPVVTPEAEFVNPWRARCRETGTAGSEGGVRKHSSAVRLAPTLHDTVEADTGNHVDRRGDRTPQSLRQPRYGHSRRWRWV